MRHVKINAHFSLGIISYPKFLPQLLIKKVLKLVASFALSGLFLTAHPQTTPAPMQDGKMMDGKMKKGKMKEGKMSERKMKKGKMATKR